MMLVGEQEVTTPTLTYILVRTQVSFRLSGATTYKYKGLVISKITDTGRPTQILTYPIRQKQSISCSCTHLFRGVRLLSRDHFP